jgi:protein involved in polysaccharide export with SLBB domain
MRTRTILIISLIISVLTSCSYKKRKILFKTEKEIKTTSENPVIITNEQSYSVVHRCQEGDVLYVRVLNEDGARSTYDKLVASREDARFTVHDSVITLPMVGNVNVIGLTKLEIIEKLIEVHSDHLIDPIIDLDFISLSINVLGEVVKPGRYQISEGLNLVDGIGLAGGFTPYGIYKNVKIIRGKGDDQEIITIDITSIKSLSHSKLRLMHDDIIYVEPRKVKQLDTTIRPYLFLTSIVSSAIALFIVIINNR